MEQDKDGTVIDLSPDKYDSKSSLSKKRRIYSISDVSISGINRVFGKRIPCWKRVVWTFVLVTCFGLTLTQVWDRVRYYNSTPVNVNVRVTRNVSLLFPFVTFCNKNLFNVTAVNEIKRQKATSLNVTDADVIEKWDVMDLIGVNGLTSRDIWDNTTHSISKMVKECWFGRGVKCHDVGEWKRVYTVLGVCYQFQTYDPVFISGLFNNMYVKLDDTENKKYMNEYGFKVHIHDPKDDALIDVRTHGSSVEVGWGKDARIAVREFKTIPTYTRPCIMNPDYSSSKCISKCFLRTLLNRTGCRMPYMKADRNNEAPLCSTPEQYSKGRKHEAVLLYDGGWRPTSCKCQKQCYENKYTVFTEAVQTGSSGARLRVYFQDLTYDEVSEEMPYDAIALLCDIGGTLGLLLGASVLTIFEFLEIGWERVIVLLKKPKS